MLTHDLEYLAEIAIRPEIVTAGGSRECPSAMFSPDAF
jgi:hypothetical protein